jgi:hypothetical protein
MRLLSVGLFVFVAGCTAGSSQGSSGGLAGEPSLASSSSPLAGTWDVVAALDQVHAGTLTLSATAFSLALPSFFVDADLSGAVPDVNGHLFGGSGPVTTTHVNEPLDLGQFPIPLGGTWTVRGGAPGTCKAGVGADLMTLDCSNLSAPMSRWFQGYDFVAHKALGSGSSTAQRKRQLTSIFGELGGEWAVVMPSGDCDVIFEDNRMTSSCSAFNFKGFPRNAFELTFTDGMASGTSESAELSARRR